MRDDYNEKTMLGQRVKGYVCVDPNEELPSETLVFIDACDSIGLPAAEERKVKPIIYEVEGTSKVKEYYVTETERAYYICDDIKVLRKLSVEDLIDIAKGHANYAQRLIAFYPFDEKEALILANTYENNYYVLSSLYRRYDDNKYIEGLKEKAKEEMFNTEKPKKYVKE